MLLSKKAQLFCWLLMLVATKSLFAHVEEQGAAKSEIQTENSSETKPQKRLPKKAKFVKGDKNEFLNSVEIKNICPDNRWTQLAYDNKNGESILVNNTDLFTQLTAQLEETGRHKGQSSISLNQFITEKKPNLVVKLCSDKSIEFTSEEIKAQKLRLVLNQKNGFKIISLDGMDAKTEQKYIFSIENTE
ncbi:MAG: hypothetical protein ACSHWU_02745 [Marinicella sp.]